jgi:hypothetical protein
VKYFIKLGSGEALKDFRKNFISETAGKEI